MSVVQRTLAGDRWRRAVDEICSGSDARAQVLKLLRRRLGDALMWWYFGGSYTRVVVEDVQVRIATPGVLVPLIRRHCVAALAEAGWNVSVEGAW
ncbi:MAG: hypothetical protein KY476_00545 [Planctomycetes bacterium]|nr:hypothetical protein [Planctomycetota bacterium]